MGIENIPKIGKIYKFLKAAASLAKSGVKEADILNAAKREFGEISDLMKLQVRKIFKDKDAPSIKNPDKQPGDVVTLVPKDKRYAKMEDTSDQASGTIMERIEGAANRIKEIMKERDAMYKPKQGLQLAEGLTRTIARKILTKKNIEIPPGRDPIGVFSETFGEAIGDVNNLAEELIEIDQKGGASGSIDDMIEMEGLYDIEIPKNPQRGLTDEEMLKLKKEVDEEKMLDEFDPTDRTENSMGGFNRIGFADGPDDPKKKKGIMNVVKKIPKVGKVVEGAASIIKFIKTLEPIEAMKEVNKVIAKEGPYKKVSDKDTDKIFKDTQDHIFEREPKPSEFDVDFDEVESSSQVFKDSKGDIKGITMGGDKDFQKAMSKAMEEGMRESENMRRLGLDPTNMTDALKYEEMKKAGQLEKNVTGLSDMSKADQLRQEFPGITDDMIEKILMDDNPQRIAEVKQTMREALKMQEKGMSTEEIINSFEGITRKDNAQGGLNYLMGL